MRKGRSISITQWHFVTPDTRKAKRGYFFHTFGAMVWNGERFIGFSPSPIKDKEAWREASTPEVITVKLEFPPPLPDTPMGTASIEAETRKRALMKRLEKDAAVRAEFEKHEVRGG